MRYRLLKGFNLPSVKSHLLKGMRERAAGGHGTSVAETIDHALREAGLLPNESSVPTLKVPSWMPTPRAHPPSPSARSADATPLNEPAFADERFESCVLQTQRSRRRYWLFTPALAREQPCPLVMMLHGCTQDPEDFAVGTRMNKIARENGVIVVYPMQSQADNPNKCWNWFRPGDQSRGAGEPAELAAITRELIGRGNVDPARVCVAGMSAGAAMASILAREFPQLYAAVGMHSGLVAGAAHDMVSALSAMQGRTSPMHAASSSRSAIPLITFHGDRDTTVVAANADRAVAAHVGDLQSTQHGRDGREYTRRCYGTSASDITIEQWTIQGGTHAWSGGDARGSHTDAAGPDASSEMMRFFLSHPRH